MDGVDGMDGSPDGVQYTVLIKKRRHLFGEKTYLTCWETTFVLFGALAVSACLLRQSFSTSKEIWLFRWKKCKNYSGRNTVEKVKESVKEIQLRMIFAVSSVTLCQPSYWGNPPSQFYGKPKLLPRWKARKDFPRNRNLVLITPTNTPCMMKTGQVSN